MHHCVKHKSLTKCCQATHTCDIFLLGSWDFCYCNFLRHRLLFLFDLASSTLKGQTKQTETSSKTNLQNYPIQLHL